MPRCSPNSFFVVQHTVQIVCFDKSEYPGWRPGLCGQANGDPVRSAAMGGHQGRQVDKGANIFIRYK
jgi:hypothetical protein